MKVYRSLFGNRNFLLLWLSGAISNIGDFFNSLALLKVLSSDPNHLGFYFALVMIAKTLPSALLGPIAGVLADRFSRRSIMIASDILRAVLILGLVFTSHPAVIITLVFLAAVVSAFFNPAHNAVLPSLVPDEQLVTAGSLAIMTQRMALLLGNGLGAAMLATVGAHNVFYIDAASFMLSALFTLFLVIPKTAIRPERQNAAPEGRPMTNFKADLKEATTFLQETAVVRHLLITLAISTIGDAGLNVLMVTFFTNHLGMAAEKLGYVPALFGGASIIGALCVGGLGSRVHWRHLIGYGALYVWVTTVGMVLGNGVIASSGFVTALGFGSGAVNVGVQAAIGQAVPNHMRGRVFGLWGMVQSAIYLVGVPTAGLLSDRLGAWGVLLGFTMPFLAAGVYAIVSFRGQHSQGTTPPQPPVPLSTP